MHWRQPRPGWDTGTLWVTASPAKNSPPGWQAGSRIRHALPQDGPGRDPQLPGTHELLRALPLEDQPAFYGRPRPLIAGALGGRVDAVSLVTADPGLRS